MSEGTERPTIWVADDVAMQADAARRALCHDYDVEIFRDGAAVLERVAAGVLPDLLVLDWHMPGVTGVEVCRFLRSQPSSVGMPILVFTATGDEQDMLEALASGADDYVGKEASDAELRARSASLVRAKLLRDRAEAAERRLEKLLVSEREARAESEAANRAKDLFLATVSHELRTPLNAILGWARLLKSGSLSADKVARALDTIERNARAQTQIVDDLLDVSRIITGKLRLELTPLDVADPVEQIVESLRPSAAAKELALEVEVERGATVAGDPARIQQIASNLVTNAIKFTPRGGSVTVTLRRIRGSVRLRVADTGAGIDPELVPHVFDRFRQGDSTTTRKHGGLGLGLAIVQQLARLHGGEAIAHSEGLGKGSAFEVSFPLLAQPERAASEPPAATPERDVRGIAVLIVDDDPDGLELVGELFRREGAIVRTAGSARAALAALEEALPDVIVSDISMPEVDGYELMRTVRRTFTERWVPALALTAHARDEDRWASIAAGFQLHLPKPLDPHLLLASAARLARSADAKVAPRRD